MFVAKDCCDGGFTFFAWKMHFNYASIDNIEKFNEVIKNEWIHFKTQTEKVINRL